MIISEICFSIRHVNRRRFIKSLKYVGKMSVFWKRIFVYPEWLHSDCKRCQTESTSPSWAKSDIKVTSKWPQSDPKVPQNDFKVMPKRRQSDVWQTKILRENVFNLLMSRLGANLGPIRSEFAFDPTWQRQKGSKTDPKWTQNGSQIGTKCMQIGHESIRSEATFAFDTNWHAVDGTTWAELIFD